MSSTLTGQGWVVDANINAIRTHRAVLTTTQIAALNSRIASGATTDIPSGTNIETPDGVIYTKVGTGTAAQFVATNV